jgi:predicted nucleic acid-binding protein
MGRSNPAPIPRLFLDSGVLLEELISAWSASRAVLILSRLRVFRIVLAEYVRGEVEENLLALLARDPQSANETIDTYDRLLQLLKPEFVPLPTKEEVEQHRHLIRHQADVPVLVSALKATPDWLLTTNTRHFTSRVAARTRRRIVTPQEFLDSIQIFG